MIDIEPLLRARAIETQTYVIAAAQIGPHNAKRTSFGNAMVNHDERALNKGTKIARVIDCRSMGYHSRKVCGYDRAHLCISSYRFGLSASHSQRDAGDAASTTGPLPSSIA